MTWSSSARGVCLIFTCSAEANQHLHVKQMMNWSDARTHCRTTFTDLSSITNQEENDLISELLQNEETIDRDKRDSDSDSADDENTSADLLTAWIGLRRKLWVWSDKTGASYRKWADEQPDHKEDCVVMDVTSSSADWFTRDCNSKEDFLCYTGESSQRTLERCVQTFD